MQHGIAPVANVLDAHLFADVKWNGFGCLLAVRNDRNFAEIRKVAYGWESQSGQLGITDKAKNEQNQEGCQRDSCDSKRTPGPEPTFAARIVKYKRIGAHRSPTESLNSFDSRTAITDTSRPLKFPSGSLPSRDHRERSFQHVDKIGPKAHLEDNPGSPRHLHA